MNETLKKKELDEEASSLSACCLERDQLAADWDILQMNPNVNVYSQFFNVKENVIHWKNITKLFPKLNNVSVCNMSIGTSTFDDMLSYLNQEKQGEI